MNSLYAVFASVLLVQSAYAQYLNYAVPTANLGSSCNGLGLGVSGLGVNSLGYNGVNTLGQTTVGLSYGLGANGGDIFSLASGSPNTPNGVSILSENELAGFLASSGVLPFATAVGVSGNLPSAGQAAVNYATAPGAALLEGGCGLGLSGAGLGAYNGLGLGNVNSLGLGNVNSLGLGNVAYGSGLIGGSSCGCGRIY